jgi:hypothetical protein
MFVGHLALIAAAMFTGAAFYVISLNSLLGSS